MNIKAFWLQSKSLLIHFFSLVVARLLNMERLSTQDALEELFGDSGWSEIHLMIFVLFWFWCLPTYLFSLSQICLCNSWQARPPKDPRVTIPDPDPVLVQALAQALAKAPVQVIGDQRRARNRPRVVPLAQVLHPLGRKRIAIWTKRQARVPTLTVRWACGA